MKSHMRLLLCVLEDSSIWCRTSTTRDFETITRRVENEGLSFLTITLPSFCSDFERSLADGCVAPSSFQGFHRPKGRAFPAFLQGLLSLVFDPCSGDLLHDADSYAIESIRQICLMFKKVELPCSPERVTSAFRQFMECEKEVAQGSEDPPQDALHLFGEISDVLWSSVFKKLDNQVCDYSLVPRHGPGATAERISGNRKYILKTWHERLEPFFPSVEYGIPNWNALASLDGVDFLEPGAEPPVRVITVPKTLKTPRIIAIEPVCMQYTQQALMAPMVQALESHRYTAGRVNFSDQTENRRLALSSSKDGRLATLDLKEASDRVPVYLVERMLRSVPFLKGAVLACRSTRADVPGHGIIPLSKFASMGSALCFPVEAMVFYTILLGALLKCQGLHVSRKNLLRVSRDVRVYGDDIIVPVEAVPTVCRELEGFNLRVNTRKSFATGNFRESCGMDAYAGVPVTPVYVRRLLPDKRQDVPEILSAVSSANQLYAKGYWRAAQFLYGVVERLIPLPIVAETSPVIGRHSVAFAPVGTRVCPNLQRDLVRGYATRIRHRPSKLDGWPALHKFFLKPGSDPIFDPKHLERSGRPLAVDIKPGWYPVH